MQQLTTGTLLQGGKYKIERVLGQGGFGITYLAEQPMLGRKVAVKEFFMKELCNRDTETSQVSIGSVGSTATVERFREKFLKEARLIACMDNNHIVRIHDIFEENGTAYYIMENVDGGSLESMINGHPIDEALALKYICEVADALKYIHAQNVLHLDVKPSNILIRKNGEAVLIDFGISKRYDDQGGQTSTTPAGISKGYAPTEQYNQGIANFSPATDIYSLGATLYKMLTGVTPPEASLLLNEDEELVRPDGISFSTWCAIEKAMEPRRRKRPQTIVDFLELLGETKVLSDIPKETNVLSEETSVIDVENHESSEETLVHPKETPIMQEDEDGNRIFTVNDVSFKMIKVQAGDFIMGNEHAFGFFHDDNAHKVSLTKDYYIGETQVTQELWQSVMGNNPSHFQNADNPDETKKCPVETIDREDCLKFFERLKELTGYIFRFPTEAEWEYAAIGGINHRNHKYSDSIEVLLSRGWIQNNSKNKTHDVKKLQANELGIYDMLGNVNELCEDYYCSYGGYAENPVNKYVADSSFFFSNVIRGGNYTSTELDERTRFYVRADANSKIGLRLALSI